MLTSPLRLAMEVRHRSGRDLTGLEPFPASASLWPVSIYEKWGRFWVGGEAGGGGLPAFGRRSRCQSRGRASQLTVGVEVRAGGGGRPAFGRRSRCQSRGRASRLTVGVEARAGGLGRPAFQGPLAVPEPCESSSPRGRGGGEEGGGGRPAFLGRSRCHSRGRALHLTVGVAGRTAARQTGVSRRLTGAAAAREVLRMRFFLDMQLGIEGVLGIKNSRNGGAMISRMQR